MSPPLGNLNSMSGDTETPTTWDETGLEAAGFGPAHPIEDLDLAQVPREPGVYVVLRSRAVATATFRNPGSAGRFRDREPSVEIDELEAAWVDQADVLYIGKANDLRQRIGLLRRFGKGEPVAHWGGRYLWQLEDAVALRVAWHTTESDRNAAERTALIDAFAHQHDAMPFANRLSPTCSVRAAEGRR